jgi:hypothetical protein
MQLSDNDDSPVPLLKDKKPRPPMTEKQKANFEKARMVRAENIKAKKEEKILQAQRALLEKEGIKVAKPIKQEEELDDEEQMPAKELPKKLEDSKTPKPSAHKTVAPLLKEEKKKPAQKVKAKAQVVVETESDDDDEEESSSDEEIIVVKRKKKAKPVAQKRAPKVNIQEDYNPSASDDEYNGCGRPKATASFHDYFV